MQEIKALETKTWKHIVHYKIYLDRVDHNYIFSFYKRTQRSVLMLEMRSLPTTI